MSSSAGPTPHRYVGYHPAPIQAADDDDRRPARGSRVNQQRIKQQQAAQVQQANPRANTRANPPRGNPPRANPQPQVQGRSTVVHDRSDAAVIRHRAEFDRNGRLLTLGTVFMLFGLILYFGGGFLFVAAYNGIYPILNTDVEPAIHRYYWWIGPILFFIGLFMFIIAFATFCKGLRCNGGTANSEGYF